ncbi:MAG TPA: hypothetical protein ENG03_04910 [Thioploca sp.]|nr:MAG: hypothetical protein B6247_25050 [Beggiatoa sp. 4572_84]RKZ55400.1 MAG: hypothetical protein DRR08_24440 [Gammaproteobacteria bacterium]HDN26426.1 hypothetical protein [Thioploca sp.]
MNQNVVNALVKFTLAIFVSLLVAGCYDSYMEREGEIAVNAFLEEMSPELARKIANIEKEISITEEKIREISELKIKHPKYAGKIETSRRQWEVLQDKLKRSLKEIREVVESAYVTYELDKIQGGNQFNKIAADLLSAADSVLASAGTTKDAIEDALNEPLPSLDDDVSDDDGSKSSPDIPKPTEPTSETKEEFEPVEPSIEPKDDEIVEEPELKPQNDETVEEPTGLKPQKTTNEPPHNISSLCEAKASLADARFNLMMMAMSTDKTEQEAYLVEIDKASTDFEKVLAAMLKDEIDNDQFTALLETWTVFKNIRETEFIPAILAGDKDKALEINGIQAERMNTMIGIIQALSGENCD